ncbi:MAG TPA: hypothetical protein VGR30_09235 [Candidatus Binatia bacterium]|jgi:hypothetical protein|nr:hypothetical protein [Candidatus Binatia bacterium]
MAAIRIVLANGGGSFASYPQGGGHWSCFLQYLFGLNALGHDVFWLEVLRSCGNGGRDQRLINIFLKRFQRYGYKDRCALLLYDEHITEPTLEAADAFGMSKSRVREIAQDADLLWNFACGLPQPLLSMFKRRVLIDGDPGHLQVSATSEMGIHNHHAFLSVGTKLHDADCEVPTLGVKWHRFIQFVFLPLWDVAPDPGEDAPFTSVTHWTWEELELKGRALSVSKRAAYLRYIDLPERTGRPFELAANIHPNDPTGDRELMLKMGWKLVNPYRVARSPSTYQNYIKKSRAEFSCPKPIHRELKTGWFSDRSAGYLASGRPVLAEDTGFSQHLPTGHGLLCFNNLEEALAGVAEIDRDYPQHMRAARELAEEYLDSKKRLPAMLSACGW